MPIKQLLNGDNILVKVFGHQFFGGFVYLRHFQRTPYYYGQLGVFARHEEPAAMEEEEEEEEEGGCELVPEWWRISGGRQQ